MKIVKCLLVLICTAAILSAEDVLPESRDLLNGFDSALYNALERDGHIFRYDEELAGPLYIPAADSPADVADIHRKLSPEVMVEGLYMVPYPEGMDRGEALERIFELSHAVSSISGAKYYSERKKKYAVLFSNVYAVDNPEDRKKMKDPYPSSSGAERSIYMHMKENALGRGYYRMDFEKSADNFSLMITNESELGFIIPAVEEHDMVISLQIIPCSDTILIYGYCGVVLQNDDFVSFLLDPYFAFYRRMTAMETWLYNSLHGKELLPPVSEPMP